MRQLPHRFARVLLVLVVLSLAAQLIGVHAVSGAHAGPKAISSFAAASQGAGTPVDPTCDPAMTPGVVCNTYEYGGNWVVDPNSSMLGQGGMVSVTNAALGNTSFVYMEIPWGANHVADNNGLIQQWVAQMFMAAGQSPSTPVAEGTLADGTLWQLYPLTKDGVSYGVLVTADTADPSQRDVITMLTSPVTTFDAAVAEVNNDFRINGASPLDGVDAAQVMAALGGAAEQTPAQVTPVAAVTMTPTASAALTQSVTVGTDTVSYGGDWQHDSVNSSPQVALFVNATDSGITFGYLSGTDAVSGGDAGIALQILDMPASFEAQNVQQLASEVLPSGRAYVLYTWQREGVPEVALALIDVTTTPGTLRAQILFAPPEVFLSSVTSVQQSFQINGVAGFAEIDTGALTSLLGSAPVTPTATAPAVVATTPTPGGFTLPPLDGTTPTPAVATTPTAGLSSAVQTVTLAGSTITYNERWIYDTVNSVPDSIAYFDPADGSMPFYGYVLEVPGTGDAVAQLGTYNTAYMERLGATDVQQLGIQGVGPTAAWSLTTAALAGMPFAVLTYADTSVAGKLQVQLLFGEGTSLPDVLADIQASVQIDGVPSFNGVDPAAVTSQLGGGAAPTPGPTDSSQASGMTVDDYRALDSPAGCDAIGWVITDPSQAPVTQADRDFRGACLGGTSYLATCGLADMAGIPYVQCDVEVTVTGAPVTVTAEQFTVIDGGGASHPVDTEITTLMTGVFGLPTLPDAPISPGAPVTGTLYFGVPADAPQPWVLQVAPDPASGGGPGTLVIEGALQARDS